MSLEAEIAALHDLERRQQFVLEQFGAAAIMRHGREHAKQPQLAHVALAEIGLQPPDRDKDLPRHAELRFDARQQRRMPLQHRPPAIDPPRSDAGRNILLERLVESAALAPVEGKHGPIPCCTPPSAWPITLCEMPPAAASWRDRRHEGMEVAAAAGGV